MSAGLSSQVVEIKEADNQVKLLAKIRFILCVFIEFRDGIWEYSIWERGGQPRPKRIFKK